jgi:hypothetical protein
MSTVASQSFSDAVRASFPVFARRIAGKPIAFFDGPGGSQVPQEVAAAVGEYLTLHNANTHGHFRTSEETDAAMTAAREAFADFLGAGSPREIVFGANMTTIAFHLSRSLGRELGPRDEVVVTELDHQANQAPWRRMAEDRGATVRAVPFIAETMQLDYEAMERAIGPRTRLVAVGGASNAVGTINDVARVAAMARAAGASASWTRFTSPRTAASTCRRWAATSSPAPPTSSLARTSASCGAAASTWSALRRTRCPPPRRGPGALGNGDAEPRGDRRRRRGSDWIAGLAGHRPTAAPRWTGRSS